MKLLKKVTGSSSSSANLTSTYLSFSRYYSYESVENAAQTACDGEVEDYTVNIGGAAITSITTAKTGIDLGNEKSISDVLIYPNPASSVLNVRMTDSRKGTYRLISLVNKWTRII
jgi:hypothetical protein